MDSRTENTKGRGKSTGDRLMSYLNTELRANNWILQNVNVTNSYTVKIMEIFFKSWGGRMREEESKITSYFTFRNQLQWSKIKL